MRFNRCFSLAVLALSLTAADGLANPPKPNTPPRRIPTPLPQPPSIGGVSDGPDAGGKGTIGLICTDLQGKPHTWSAGRTRSPEFEKCVSGVVENVQNKVRDGAEPSAEVVDLNLMMGDYGSYLEDTKATLYRAIYKTNSLENMDPNPYINLRGTSDFGGRR